MASPQGDGGVVDVTVEGERGQEEDEVEVVESEEDAETDDGERADETEGQAVVELGGDEEQDENKQEESEDDDVQFVGSTERANEHQEMEEERDQKQDEVQSEQERSRADTDAIMAANGFVTPATLEAELQCIICQYALFKPMSAICGHSFCRVCLMNSFLTRPIEEAQCPICRVEILKPFSSKASLASMFYVNVTLWNLVQLLIPSVAKRISAYQQEEEREFTHKLDELDAKWKIFTLSERAAIYHRDHDDAEAGPSSRWEEDHEGHEEYPVLKVDDTQDGNLHVSRNVVLDTNDENEDGIMNMRVGIAIVEFPSIFELYNEHQECSVNVIKMEEDEEMADGMPFFMNEDGDDDGFVCGSYYNEISLQVCDEAGNCVMERTRGAQGGVVTFPGLRLDVPGGLYSFRFSDDLYGLKLCVTTRLREPHEISDTPVADYVSLINDEARDGSRRNRRRNHDSDSEDYYDEGGNESDDSFIVDDLNGEVHHEEPVGRFSGDEEEGHWDYQSDDEAADEAREQRRLRRQQRSGRRSERDVQLVEEHQEEEEISGEENERERSDGQDNIDGHEEDETVDDEVRPGRRNVQIVEEATFSSDGEADQEEERNDVDVVEDEDKEEEQHETHEVARSRRRNANQIVDSEDEDEGAHVGSDEEEKENDVGDDAQDGHGEQESNTAEEAVEEDEGEKEDTLRRNSGRKVKRAQWFQSDESDEEDDQPHPDTALSPGDEDGVIKRRPRKRARAGDRQVRVIDEGESDEKEQEKMERSIVAANSGHAHDNEETDDEASDSQFRRVHLYDDGHENEEENDDVLDYPDEDEGDDEGNDYQEEEDDDD